MGTTRAPTPAQYNPRIPSGHAFISQIFAITVRTGTGARFDTDQSRRDAVAVRRSSQSLRRDRAYLSGWNPTRSASISQPASRAAARHRTRKGASNRSSARARPTAGIAKTQACRIRRLSSPRNARARSSAATIRRTSVSSNRSIRTVAASMAACIATRGRRMAI